ncbi:MAG: hypothetical protein LIO63_01090 [Akkermansia sp.]|nr:hypothetical protein [Akkermansia sp.]
MQSCAHAALHSSALVCSFQSVAISVMKQGRKLATTKKDLAERLGTATTTREGSGKLLQDLIELKARYENFGLYPELTEAARLWDGKSEPDPIAQAMGLTDAENERLAAEAGMSREEWEEAQRVAEAKREAEKATGSLFGDGGSFSLTSLEEETRRLKNFSRAELRTKAYSLYNRGNIFDERLRRSDAEYDISQNKIEAIAQDDEELKARLKEEPFKPSGTRYTVNGKEVTPNEFDNARNEYWDKVDKRRREIYRKLEKENKALPASERKRKKALSEEAWAAAEKEQGGEPFKVERYESEPLTRLEDLTQAQRRQLAEEIWDNEREFDSEEVEDLMRNKKLEYLDALGDYVRKTLVDSGYQVSPVTYSARSDSRYFEVTHENLEGSLKVRLSDHKDTGSYQGFKATDISMDVTGTPDELAKNTLDEVRGAFRESGEFDGGHGSFSIAGERVPREEAVRIAREFGALSESEGVRVEVPEVYAEDGKEARAFAREVYRKLQEETAGGELLEMPDGRRAKVSRRGLSEVKNHSADRRVLAALCALRDLCRQSIYINSAANTQPEKKGKKGIVRFHYYVAKGNFVGASAVNERAQDEAYVNIVLSEYENGDLFYDLDATNVEDVNKNEGVSASLPGARIPNAGEQKGEAPYVGRIQQTKQFVNYVNKKIKEESSGSHGSFSVIGPHARTWDKYTDRAFAGRDDGKMRAEIDASQARLKGARTAPRLEAEDIYALLGTLAEGNEQVEKLIKFRHAWDRYLELIRNEAHLTEKEKAELRGMKNWVPDTRNELTGLADRVLKELGYDTTITKRSANRVEALRSAALMADVKTLKKYNKYRKDRESKLGDILDYPELFDACPELAEMKVDGDETQANGSFSPSTRTISLNKSLFADSDKLRSTLLHEIQHAIQDIEGFAAGSNAAAAGDKAQRIQWAREKLKDYRWDLKQTEAYPEEMKDMDRSALEGARDKLLADYMDFLEKLSIEKRKERREATDEELKKKDELWMSYRDYDSLLSMVDSKRKKNAREVIESLKEKIKQTQAQLRGVHGVRQSLSDYELYRRTPGEIESRNVQERRDWTAEQRQATPFNDTLEYPGEAVNFGSFSVAEAKEKKLFDEHGVMQAANGVLIDGTSFSYVAMHASPHWIQDKFRMDKIGSGEGAQMFGAGMYFAENDKVNDKYLRQFERRSRKSWLVNGKEVSEKDLKKLIPGYATLSGCSYIPDYLLKPFGDHRQLVLSVEAIEETIKSERKITLSQYSTAAKEYERRFKNGPDLFEENPEAWWKETEENLEHYRKELKKREESFQKELDAVKKLREWVEAGNTFGMNSKKAYNYLVEIDAEDYELLWWDDKMGDKLNAGALELMRKSPVEEVRKLAERAYMNLDIEPPEPHTGRSIYKKLTLLMAKKHGLNIHATKDYALAQKYASEALLASGIKGLKYADGFTRGKAKRWRKYNSVIWDMSSLKITHVARGEQGLEALRADGGRAGRREYVGSDTAAPHLPDETGRAGNSGRPRRFADFGKPFSESESRFQF